MSFITEMLFVFKELIKNGILLFGLGFLYALNNYGIQVVTRLRKVLLGVMIGAIAIFIMMFPLQFQAGIFFDARGVLYSISGLFFGGTTTLIAAIIGISYRSFVGGAGVYSGITTIVVTSLAGILWRVRTTFLPKWKPIYEHYTLGMIASLLTLASFLLLPDDSRTILKVVPTYILVFPFVSVILGKIFNIQKDRALANAKIQEQQVLLQASIDALDITEIYSLDAQYRYLSFNQYHAKVMKRQCAAKIARGQNFLDYICNSRSQSRARAYINRALVGEKHTAVYMVKEQEERYLEDVFSPIFDREQRVIGVTIMSKDVTERKRYEDAILNLSYYDSLTKIPNRRYYDEKFEYYNQEKYYPLSIISTDINGLKIMNDAFGHHVGDQLLCSVAQHLKSQFEGKGEVARIGGDEFSVLLPNVGYEEAENMMRAFNDFLTNKQISGIHISCSFGLATCLEKEVTKTSLDQLSDDDMYISKFANASENRQRVIKEVLEVLHARSLYEKEHVTIMKKVTAKMADALKLGQDEQEKLAILCELHDIGKISIDENILTKKEELTDVEWNGIKKHPERGYRILTASLEYIHLAKDVFCHHEHFDGTGYPRQLAKDAIPLGARIIAIAETYSALTSPASYRESVSSKAAIEIIKQEAGKQFDPALVEVFLSISSSLEAT